MCYDLGKLERLTVLVSFEDITGHVTCYRFGRNGEGSVSFSQCTLGFFEHTLSLPQFDANVCVSVRHA